MIHNATTPDSPTTSELPHLSWDICDSVFSGLGNRFRGDFREYIRYLREKTELLIHGSGDETSDTAVAPEKLDLIPQALRQAQVTHVAVHFRTRAQSSDRWLRMMARTDRNDLANEVNADDVFPHYELGTHAFEKARENGTLGFVFAEGRTSEEQNYCTIAPPVLDLMLRVVLHARERGGRIVVNDQDLTDIGEEEREAIRRYCEGHTDNHVYISKSSADAFSFVIQSCIATLQCLASGKWNLPRSVLLTPVFVGNNRVGGVSFFSDGVTLPASNAARDLKIFGRNLLTHLFINEDFVMQAKQEVKQELAPITHFYMHTYQKAFTTPVQNIADEIEKHIAETSPNSGKTERSDYSAARLRTIAVFLRSFSARSAGAFSALQEPAGEQRGQRRFQPYSRVARLDGNAVIDHIKSAFAVTMANDIYDDEAFKDYRLVLGDLDALERLVDLDVHLDHPVPGTADIWHLHLLHMAQNSLESMDFFDVLERYKGRPAYLAPAAGSKIEIRSARGGMNQDRVILTIDDTGLPFNPVVRDQMGSLLERLADANQPLADYNEVTSNIRSQRTSYSTKSAQASGAGLITFAYFLSQICRIQGGPDLSDSSIVERGRMTLGDHPKITITLPVSTLR